MLLPIRTLVSVLAVAAALSAPGGASEPLKFAGGRIEVIDRARLASDQNGLIASDVPLEGTRVDAGQLVVQLQDDVARAQLASAQVLANNDADVRAKQNAAQLAQVDFERAQLANQKSPGTVPELEVMRLELAHKQAVLEKEQAQTELELNRRKRDEAAAFLNTFQVKAPFSGTVTQVFRNRGEAVRQGEAILELVSINRVRITLDVPLAQRGELREGMPVQVRPEPPALAQGENQTPVLSGRITFINPVAEQLSRTVRVHVIVDDNREGFLVPGLGATVTALPAVTPSE